MFKCFVYLCICVCVYLVKSPHQCALMQSLHCCQLCLSYQSNCCFIFFKVLCVSQKMVKSPMCVCVHCCQWCLSNGGKFPWHRNTLMLGLLSNMSVRVHTKQIGETIKSQNYQKEETHIWLLLAEYPARIGNNKTGVFPYFKAILKNLFLFLLELVFSFKKQLSLAVNFLF